MSGARRALLLGALVAALLAWAWLGLERRGPPVAAAAAPEAPVRGLPALERAPELEDPDELGAPLRTPVAPPPIPPLLDETESAAPEAGAALPAGSLEVLVEQDGRAVAGARVLLHGLGRGGPPQELDRLLEHGASEVTGADGVAAFGGVAPDTYNLRVSAAHLPVLEITVVLTDERGASVLAAYGTSALEGKVYDEAGAPLEGCWILVRSQDAPGGYQWSHMWASSGADGAYRIDGLLAGVAWITRTCDEQQSVSLAFEAGARQRVDFGWPGGAPAWKGTVHGSDGAPFDVPGTLTTQRLENGERGQFEYGADGTFEVRLRPGRYAVGAMGYEGSFVVGEIEIPRQGLTEDVTLPLARVVVELDYAGSGVDAAQALARASVVLRRPGDVGRLTERLAPERRFFAGVPTGDYELVVESRSAAFSTDGVRVTTLTVPPGSAVVHARIAVP